jgi:hypothetical protein
MVRARTGAQKPGNVIVDVDHAIGFVAVNGNETRERYVCMRIERKIRDIAQAVHLASPGLAGR